jgi:hypothetical protein
MKKILYILLASMTATTPLPASAANLCGPRAGVKWLTLQQARQRLAKAGYAGFRVGVEHGCYEGEGSKGGRKLEVYLDPVTGKVVRVRRDRD